MASSSSSSSSSSAWYNPNEESYTISEDKPLHILNPNQFYKICPSDSSNKNVFKSTTDLNNEQPMCGDGSQFCFYFSKPSQRQMNTERILIEIMGGGACWDSYTCQKQASYLYLKEELDDLLGKSCQEIQYGINSGNGNGNGDNGNNNNGGINMLCSGSLGNSTDGNVVDFTQYNTIIIPYCTQDTHLGSNTMIYNTNDDNDNDGDDGNNNNNNNNNDDDDDDDGSNKMTVHHKGANNIQFVLNWMYKNFPPTSSLRHVAITGCSAGGTAVPVVQQLIHQHYNHFGYRSTQIASIVDSPVFLTPSYFLQNSLPNWNVVPILHKIDLPFSQFLFDQGLGSGSSDEEYPTMMWDYILKRGDNRNRWGFISHTSDPVSLMYYQYMSGSNNNDDDDHDDNYNDDNYNNDDYNNDDSNKYDEDSWYAEMTDSVSYIEKKHRNIKSYWIDSQGHCTFGLYYAIEEGGSDFQNYAGSIFKEDNIIISTQPSVGALFVAVAFGVSFGLGLASYRIHRSVSHSKNYEDDDEDEDGIDQNVRNEINENAESSALPPNNNNNNDKKEGLIKTSMTDNDNNAEHAVQARTIKSRSRSYLRKIRSIFISLSEYPVTAGYTFCITMYFLFMIYEQKFAHPINNPSFGPNSIGLSLFGINNPALIVYQHQWYRLFTSNFMVSGIATYVIAMVYIYFRTSRLESRMIYDYKSPYLFVSIAVIIATIINASYCLIPSQRGASTTSIPLLIGLQCFHITLYWNTFLRPILSMLVIAFDFLLLVFIFPLGNSWVMIITACIIGPILAKFNIVPQFDTWLPGPMNVLKQQQQQQRNQQQQQQQQRQQQTGTTPTAAMIAAASSARSGINVELSATGRPGGGGRDNNYNSNNTNDYLAHDDDNTSYNYDSSGGGGGGGGYGSGTDGSGIIYETMDDQRSTCPDHNRTRKWKFIRRVVCVGLLAFFVLLVIPLFVTIVAIPDKLYVESFYTGCQSFYTTDIDDLSASSFLSSSSSNDQEEERGGDNRQRRHLFTETSRSFLRWLAGDDDGGDYECAEFCIPHIVVPAFRYVLRKKNVPIYNGRCIDQDGGIYSTHVLDKTFSAFSYSLDVELYGSTSSNDDDN
jgi:hypothetical protein